MMAVAKHKERHVRKTVSPKLLFVACAIALVGLVPHARAAQPGRSERVTNMALLEKTLSNAVESLVKRMPVNNLKKPVIVAAAGTHEAGWIVENLLGQRLREEGVSVLVTTPQPPAVLPDTSQVDTAGVFVAQPTKPLPAPVPTQLVLSYRIAEIGMEYPRIWRSHYFGKKQVQRHAYAALSVRIVDDSTGGLVWVGDSKANETDIVPASEIVFLEGKGEAWQKGTMPPGRLGAFIEPLVVAAIVGGLVYLFYSNKE
jgi:hypothetical protein